MKPIGHHLTTAQHVEAARLLKQIEDNLSDLSRIVARAPYTDQTLRIAKAVQEILIDPLREVWDRDPAGRYSDNPYQSVGYGVSGAKRLMRQLRG